MRELQRDLLKVLFPKRQPLLMEFRYGTNYEDPRNLVKELDIRRDVLIAYDPEDKVFVRAILGEDSAKQYDMPKEYIKETKKIPKELLEAESSFEYLKEFYEANARFVRDEQTND